MTDSGAVRFDPRFLEKHAGSLLSDPITALVELVANAWDASATRVEVTWPDPDAGVPFKISDNGHGMTAAQFADRWGTLDYDRGRNQGLYAESPEGEGLQGKRPVFGRNGRGRYAAFAFHREYTITTLRGGTENVYRVSRSRDQPLAWEKLSSRPLDGHGTTIEAGGADFVQLDAATARRVVGTRFMTDPQFAVSVNGSDVTFDDVPKRVLQEETVTVSGVGKLRILYLKSWTYDVTTHNRGLAWRVHKRLVGEPSWDAPGGAKILDGRSADAKMFSVIIFADPLADMVLPDWSGFDTTNSDFRRAADAVTEAVGRHIDASIANRGQERKRTAAQKSHAALRRMPLLARERWRAFVDEVVDTCPTIAEKQLMQLTGILANLEVSRSKYGLLGQLQRLDSARIDDLHGILRDWTVQYAKIVLDEVASRLKVIAELKDKIATTTTEEVAELQPLFARGLWMFGPSFESIEYTSNQGMTTVIRNLFGQDVPGSANRPDFVVLPDGSLGVYGRPSYGADFQEDGVEHVVIVELKKPGIGLGQAEVDQGQKYVKELLDKGMLHRTREVHIFPLGTKLDGYYGGSSERQAGALRVLTHPLLYQTLIERAEKRMMSLHARVKQAPFLSGELDAFEAEPEVEGQQLLPEEITG